jgi:predicted small metal-binding protein
VEREVLEEEFHSLLDDVADGVKQKLDISEAVKRRSSSETAAKMISESSTVNDEIIAPEIESYRQDLKKQFSRLLEAVEDEEDVRTRRENLLEHDIFYQNLENESQEVERKILERLESLHKAITEIKKSEADDVWEAVSQEFSRREAEKFIDDLFGFMDELEQHEHELEYCKEVEMSKISKILPFTVEVDYTPEALEVMKESEKEVREEMEEKIEELYSDEDKPIKL